MGVQANARVLVTEALAGIPANARVFRDGALVRGLTQGLRHSFSFAHSGRGDGEDNESRNVDRSLTVTTTYGSTVALPAHGLYLGVGNGPTG